MATISKGSFLKVTSPFAYMSRIDFEPGDLFRVSNVNDRQYEVKPVDSKRDGAAVPDIVVEVPRADLPKYFTPASDRDVLGRVFFPAVRP